MGWVVWRTVWTFWQMLLFVDEKFWFPIIWTHGTVLKLNMACEQTFDHIFWSFLTNFLLNCINYLNWCLFLFSLTQINCLWWVFRTFEFFWKYSNRITKSLNYMSWHSRMSILECFITVTASKRLFNSCWTF